MTFTIMYRTSTIMVTLIAMEYLTILASAILGHLILPIKNESRYSFEKPTFIRLTAVSFNSFDYG